MNQQSIRNLIGFPAVFMCIIVLAGSSGCANIIPPTGGPRDTLPPVLVNATPKSYTVNFTGNRIVLTFDEYIDLKDVHQDLVVSPVPKTDPTVDSKLKTVTIRLKDSLEPKTTYSFDFGKSIRDINEGNILKNFTYVFSTGPYIDSMRFSGRVLLAETGKTDSTLIAMLYRDLDDSAVAKHKPRYFTHLDSTGKFMFNNLPPGRYALYALKDESGQKEYLSKTQLFAFSDTPVVISENYTPVTLYAYADTTGSKPTKKSSNQKSQAAKKSDKEKEKRLIVQINLSNGQLDVLGPLQFTFPVPIKSFDSSKVVFTDEKFNPITSFHYIVDTSMKKVTLVYPWTMGTKYHIIASREFAEDTLGQRLLKTDTISFETKKESDYGSVRLRFRNLNLSRNPVLQFIQSDAVKKTYVFGKSNIYYEKLVPPGDYELRILYDTNKNGVWDPGNFFGVKRQPETVQSVRKSYTVKGNWDNEADITL